jgi:uncharacterized DUF497 family protein
VPGLSFEEASEAFEDSFSVDEYDDENSTDEDRYNIVGYVEGLSFITVAYTMRSNLIRIFSARKADLEEIGAYVENVKRHFGSK